MSRVRFLGDEHIRRSLADAVWHEYAGVEFYFVGDEGCPPRRSPDPELLLFAEAEKMSLLTSDHRTMPDHIRDHLAAGRHTWGAFLIKHGARWRPLIHDLVMIGSASEAEDWLDITERLPW